MACDSRGVDAAEAAKMLGISASHFYLLKRTGRIGPTPVHLGRAVRYDCEELERWFSAGTPPRAKWDALKQRKTVERKERSQ
jgi:predicted DNA-binding transcriptional regulator AlpA